MWIDSLCELPPSAHKLMAAIVFTEVGGKCSQNGSSISTESPEHKKRDGGRISIKIFPRQVNGSIGVTQTDGHIYIVRSQEKSCKQNRQEFRIRVLRCFV